jgi:tetratricopeptide (TPR) repeat protein
MPPARVRGGRRWQAFLIITLFFFAVVGAAAIGWWYARESPPHMGPIVVIAVDAVPAESLQTYGAPRTDAPAIDALAADAVVFDRAYAHSPQLLPAGASILSGLLPIDHGVRDDAGFALRDDARSLAELLRNRGFATGAAMSSFLLRRESGVAQGFAFFDAELPEAAPSDTPALERDGALTLTAAEEWVRQQSGQRFFLFVQVPPADADESVARLTELLKARQLYDDATVVFVGSRGDTGSGMALDERALRIPLLVKQPGAAGAGRRVLAVVQHVDLVPTLLDMVRAPIPDGLRGRSLRAILDGDDIDDVRPVYAEALTAQFRFGGRGVFAVSDDRFRYVRGVNDELVAIAAAAPDAADSSAGSDAGRLGGILDRLLAVEPPDAAIEIPPADEERFALLGYLPRVRLPGSDAPLTADQQRSLVEAHRNAAILVGQKRYSAGIRALQAIVRDQPTLAAVHHQIGVLLSRTGRFDEAIQAFAAARLLRPESAVLALALAEAQMRSGRLDAAQETAAEAVTLADANTTDGRGRAAAHEIAARVALARQDPESAVIHAEAAREADGRVPVAEFVNGRILYDAAKYDEALTVFKQADAALREHGGALADLHMYIGDTLARLERSAEAELAFREELLAFPRSTQAYARLALLYRDMDKADAVEDVINELVAATPTPEGYAVAAQLWTELGDRSRAEALRSDARTRFRGDPSLALLGRDGRR